MLIIKIIPMYSKYFFIFLRSPFLKPYITFSSIYPAKKGLSTFINKKKKKLKISKLKNITI